MSEKWARNTPEQLRAAVYDITYEARWLARGHEWSNELWARNSDVANLMLEAALVHCRVLLYFLAPGGVRAGDVLACEYLNSDPALAPYAVVSEERFQAVVGCTVRDAKNDLGAWLAHLGGLRLSDRPKESRLALLAGSRRLFVEFVDRLDSRWRSAFDEARCAVLHPTGFEWPSV
jgi:hypothetical protein